MAHLYIALAVGFVFVVLGLTGSVNVFFRELEEIHLPSPVPGANPALRPLDDIVQTLRAAHPQRTGPWTLVLPGHGKAYLWAIYKRPEETADEYYGPLRVLVNPYTGEIAGESFWGQTPWTLVYELHVDFLAGKLGTGPGEIGSKIISFLGLPFLISCLTGLYLWWPSKGKLRQSLTLKRGASPERFYFDLHKTTGFYGSAILIILAFSGFSFAYGEYVEPLVRLVSPVTPGHLKEPALESKPTRAGPPLSVADAVTIADRLFPTAELRAVELPDGPAGVYAIEKRQPGEANRIRPRSKVWIDQYNGTILAVQDPNRFSGGETFLSLLWPLHSGEAFGLAGRILWCVAGLAPLLLYVSGLIRWQQKRRASRGQRTRRRSQA